MAEESVTLPDISGGVYSRRGSTGKLTSSKGGEKVVPNYLRASTGSCHDFCKFGHKDASEEKERRPFLRRGMSKPPDGHNHNDPDIQIFVPSTVRSEKNKGSLSLLSKSADCSNSDALMAAGLSRRKSSVPAGVLRKSLDYTNVSKVEKNKMSPNRRLTGSFDSKLSGLIGASSSKAKIITSSREEKKKSPPTILRTSPDQSLKKGKSTSQPKLYNPSNRASQSAEALSLSEKLGSSLKLKSNNNAGRVVSAGRSNTNFGTGQKSSSVPRKVAPLRKLQMPSPKVPLSSPKRNVSGGLARALSSPRVSLSPRSSLAGIAGLNTAKNRGGKVTSGLMKRNETEQAKTENKIKKKVASNVQHKIEDKTTKKVANKQRMNKQVKEVSPDMVQEKTLYVIKMDTEDKHLESGLNERLDGDTETETSLLPDSSMKPLSIPGCSSSSSSLTNEDEDEESEYSLTDDEELDSLDIEEQKKWNRRKGVVRSESQDPQPVKLRFRRGKVIEIKSENEGPRKLKFRRRSLGKDQNAKEVERRMSYRDRGEEGEVKKGGDDSEKVVLRHQDVDGKKDGQGGLLFNNVIEETASKLAETRKSKVKALVGAFETVISLQDGKPSSGNVNLGLFPAALT